MPQRLDPAHRPTATAPAGDDPCRTPGRRSEQAERGERPELRVERRATVRRASRGRARAGKLRARRTVAAAGAAIAIAGSTALWGALGAVVALLVAITAAQALHGAALRRRTRALAHLSRTDHLTGLGNVRALWHDLAAAVDAGPVGLAMFDMDGFKLVNDRFGHPAGDAVLRGAAETLRAELGQAGHAYRYGGDELVALLPGADEHEAAGVARRALEAIARPRAALPAVRCSAGAAAGTPGASAHHLIARADRALATAKAAGRDTVALASDLGTESTEDAITHAARRAALAMAAAALDARDSDTAEHSEDVVLLCDAVAGRLGLGRGEREHLLAAARLHDVGKVAIPDRILSKPGPLDELEWAIMREHTVTGERILRAVPELAAAAPLVRHAHERWDGTGYPDGLSGEEIPLASRVILCADAFHAIRSDRPYRAGRSAEEALHEIEVNAGTQFDPAVAGALAAVVRTAGGARGGLRLVGGSSRLLALLLTMTMLVGTAMAFDAPVRHAVGDVLGLRPAPHAPGRAHHPAAPPAKAAQAAAASSATAEATPAIAPARAAPAVHRAAAHRAAHHARRHANPRHSATPTGGQGSDDPATSGAVSPAPAALAPASGAEPVPAGPGVSTGPASKHRSPARGHGRGPARHHGPGPVRHHAGGHERRPHRTNARPPVRHGTSRPSSGRRQHPRPGHRPPPPRSHHQATSPSGPSTVPAPSAQSPSPAQPKNGSSRPDGDSKKPANAGQQQASGGGQPGAKPGAGHP